MLTLIADSNGFYVSPRSCPREYLWRHADFVLEHDESAGVGIFTSGVEEEEEDERERAAAFLQKYPRAHLIYLEYVVVEKHSKVGCSLAL